MRIKLFEFFKGLAQFLGVLLLATLLNYALGFLIMLGGTVKPAKKFVVPYSVTINPLFPCRGLWG